MLANRFLLVLFMFSVGSLSLSQGVPELATDIRVTVQQEGSRNGPVKGATVTVSRSPSIFQERATDDRGVAAFAISVDASLMSLRVSHATLGEVELPFVHWRRTGNRAEAVVTLRDRPPYHITARAIVCDGIIRLACAPAEGSLFLYRRGLQDLVERVSLKDGSARIALPFPPNQLEVVFLGTEGIAQFFPELPVQHLPSEIRFDVVIRRAIQ